MAQPITWRTVNAPSIADASRPLAFANLNLTQGFDALRSVLAQQEATDKANYTAQKDINTQALMNRIYAAGTPEQMAAARGEIAQSAEQFGAGQVDQAAIRTALDKRPGELQDRAVKTWAFENAALDQREAPTVDQVRGLIAQGKTAEAAPLIAGLSSRNGATLFASLDQRQQEELRRTREGEKWGWEKDRAAHDAALRPFQLAEAELKPQQIKAQMDDAREQLRIARLNAGTNSFNAQTQRMSVEGTERDRLERRLTDVAGKLGDIGDQRAVSAKGTEALFKAIRENVKDPDQAEALVRNAGRALSDPANANLSVSEAMSAVLATGDNRTWLGRMIGTSSDRGGDLADRFATIRTSPEFAARAAADAAREALLREQAGAIRAQLRPGSAPAGTVPRGTAPKENAYKNADGTSKNPADHFEGPLRLTGPASGPAPAAAPAAVGGPLPAVSKRLAELELEQKSLDPNYQLSPQTVQYLEVSGRAAEAAKAAELATQEARRRAFVERDTKDTRDRMSGPRSLSEAADARMRDIKARQAEIEKLLGR